jgi:ribose-phosphate pyrophosphokinase
VTEVQLRIFSGTAHPELAQEIARLLNAVLGKSTTRNLPDSETHVSIDEYVRDQDIFLIQPCSAPVNDHLMELLLYLDAFRRASVQRVNAVIPYFPYARQDRMAKGREAISARVVANLLENQGVNRVILLISTIQPSKDFLIFPSTRSAPYQF